MQAEGHRAALINADPPASEKITRCLLDDLAEALPVYARLADVSVLELFQAPPDKNLPRCDAALLAYALQDPAPAHDAATRIAPGTRVYALTHLEGRAGTEAATSFSQLEALCEAAGARWMGGLVVCGDELVLPAAGSPRMGWRRRWISEPLDQLIIALLAGTDAGTLTARPGALLWMCRHIFPGRRS